MTDQDKRRKARNEYMRKWNAAHREEVNARVREYRARQPPELIAQWKKDWYEKNKETTKTRAKVWKAANREKVLESSRRYSAEHPREMLARVKAWQKANPEKTRAAQQRNDAKRAGRFGRHRMTRADYEKRLASQGGGCAICGTRSLPVTKRFFAIDHDHICCDFTGRSCGKCIRALLCFACNSAIGLLRDSPEILDKAAAYLRKHHARRPALLFAKHLRVFV